MTMADVKRRLVWHGVLLFVLSLVEGMFVYSMRNPRMGLTAHVGGITTALFFLGIAAAWDQLRLLAARGNGDVVADGRRRLGQQRGALTRRASRHEQGDPDRGSRPRRARVAGDARHAHARGFRRPAVRRVPASPAWFPRTRLTV